MVENTPQQDITVLLLDKLNKQEHQINLLLQEIKNISFNLDNTKGKINNMDIQASEALHKIENVLHILNKRPFCLDLVN